MLPVYVSVAATVIASINTMISAYLTNFPPQNANIKKNLIIGSILMTGIAALTVVATAAKEASDKAATLRKQDDERQQLGVFIAEGSLLLQNMRDSSRGAPYEETENWATKVEAFLRNDLGPGYVQRFRDGTGMLHGTPMGIDEKRAGYWNGIYERTNRLEQFSGEIPR